MMFDVGFPRVQYCFHFLLLLNKDDITSGISNNIKLFADGTFLLANIKDYVIQQTFRITNDLDTIKKLVKHIDCRYK